MGYLNSDGLETQIQYIKRYVEDEMKKHASIPIGHEYFSMNPNVPDGSLPMLGGVYSRETYADLWDWVQTQTGYLITDSAWVTLSNTQNGNVPFYSDGDGSTTFRVPSLKCWVRGANGTVSEVGSYLEAGLPNISGSLQVGAAIFNETGGAIALNDTPSTNTYGSNNSLANTHRKVSIDASRSSAIYGNASTVVPESIVGMWLVKAYGVIVDTGQIDEQQYIDDRIAAEVTRADGKYLPLTGGTITDSIEFSHDWAHISSSANTSMIIQHNKLTQGVELWGGTSSVAGACLILRGASNNGGKFQLCASEKTSDSDSSHSRVILEGNPNGSLKWNGQSVQTSSDKRLKQDFSDVPADVLKAWSKVEWKQFKYKADKESKGDSCRWHTGLVAQDVKEVGEENNVDLLKYGILCHDVREATENSEAVDMWTVRYTEALCMEVIYLRNEIKKLHEEIKALKTV